MLKTLLSATAPLLLTAVLLPTAAHAADGASGVQAVPLGMVVTVGGKPRVWYAVVSSSGSKSRGSASGASGNAGGVPNAYQVDFPVNVANCSYHATLGSTATGAAAPGSATTSQRAGFPNAVLVRTFNASGAPAKRDFHLAVAC